MPSPRVFMSKSRISIPVPFRSRCPVFGTDCRSEVESGENDDGNSIEKSAGPEVFNAPYVLGGYAVLRHANIFRDVVTEGQFVHVRCPDRRRFSRMMYCRQRPVYIRCRRFGLRQALRIPRLLYSAADAIAKHPLIFGGGRYIGHLIFYMPGINVSPPDRAPLAVPLNCDVGLDRLTGCLVFVEIIRQ